MLLRSGNQYDEININRNISFPSPEINFRAENSNLLKQVSAYSRAIYRSVISDSITETFRSQSPK